MNETQPTANGARATRRQPSAMFKQSVRGVTHVWEDLTSFDFNWIVPYKTVASLKVLRNPSAWVMLLFGFAPLAFNGFVTSVDQVRAFLVCYAALAWAGYFYVFVAKRATSVWLGLASAAFTLAIGVRLDLLLKQAVLLVFYGWAAQPSGLTRLLGNIVVGLNEEFWKALPLLLLAFVLGRIKKPVDGIFCGALSGLSFAAFEGYRYITRVPDSEAAMQILLRCTSLPFLHAVWTGIGGYFIALATISRRRTALCLLGIALAATVHGCYDAASHALQAVVAALIYLLFISYIERSRQMVQELEEVEAAQRVRNVASDEPPRHAIEAGAEEIKK